MALHNQALAAQEHERHMDPIYYCATGAELPMYEPCKDRKDERNI
jgi:hypothetical protein